ncbi:hypothetical protein GX48_06281 [Paracoccidioides brasiliensis]|nr:hypothetical protein GX48_06281 [Paracoccidioides brasiliensis]
MLLGGFPTQQRAKTAPPGFEHQCLPPMLASCSPTKSKLELGAPTAVSEQGSSQRDFVLKHVLSTDVDTDSQPSYDTKPSEKPQQRRPGQYIGAIDQGTTTSKFIIFDDRGDSVVSHQVELNRICQHSGWHEEDPEEIVSSVEKCIDQTTKAFVSQGFSISDIQAVGVATHRGTTVVWGWETGKPLHNAIAWPDTRTTSLVRELKK